MTDFKLSDSVYVLCFFLLFVIPCCLAIDASDELRHVRFIYDNNRDDNCGCQIGKCIHLSNGGFRCDCYDHAWTGEKCETLAWTLSGPQQPMQPKTYDQSCSYHGQMTSAGCSCHDNWGGNICQFAPGTLDHCNHYCGHGHCAVHTDPHRHVEVHLCECLNGWHGEHCTIQNTEPMQMDHCHNHCQHGVCVGPVSGYYHCQCDPGWYGGHCEHEQWGNLHLTESTTNTPPTTTIRAATTTTTTTTTKAATTTTTKAATATTTTKAATTTTRSTTTPKPTPIVTSPPPVSATSSKYASVTTTHSTSGISPCEKSAILTAVAKQTEVVNQNAGECSTGSHSSHDALVLTHCQVPSSVSSWQQGTNVMSNCNGSASLPTYTAVAAFDNGMYSSKGSLSGIFLGCTANGFKMAFQSCGQPPQIAEITMGGTNALNPVVYYAVV